MRTLTNAPQKGFIALIAVLLVGTILFTMVATLARSHLTHRFLLLYFEEKIQSEKLADACMHIVKVLLYDDHHLTESSLPYGGIFPVDDLGTCTILSLRPTSTTPLQYEVMVHAEYKKSHTLQRAVIEVETGILRMRKEILTP